MSSQESKSMYQDVRDEIGIKIYSCLEDSMTEQHITFVVPS